MSMMGQSDTIQQSSRVIPPASGCENAAMAKGEVMQTMGELSRVCLEQPEAGQEYPFGDHIRVFKVAGKMFALVPEGTVPASISLKCDPDLAQHLRQQYSSVTGGYHLNKRHWNTVVADGSVPDEDLRQWIEDSYDLVVDSLPKAVRLRLQGEVRGLE
jgi:predicted DNA-binding protein (MmcQ/YjbR family)